MTYRLDRKERSGGRKRALTFVLLLGAIVFFWPSIRTLIYSGTEPIIKRIFVISGAAYIVPDFIETYFSSRASLLEEKEVLQKQIESLENKVTEQELKLREISGSLESSSTTRSDYSGTVIASSLTQDLTKLYSTVIFSKGFSDGVGEGNLVYIRGRQAVCKISEVYARTSKCELFSGFSNTTEGVSASSSVPLSLEGRGGHYIANILRESSIVVGEKILLREDQSFVLGEVVQVFNNDQDTSWHVLVRGLHNPAASSLYYIESNKQ